MSETITTLSAVQRSRMLPQVREKLQELLRASKRQKQAVTDYKRIAGETLPDLTSLVGVNDGTVLFLDDDGNEQAAKVTQAEAGHYWNTPELIEWLKVTGKWGAVKSTVLDERKLAAEIEAGNIKFADIQHLYLDKTAPAAYVNFVNATAESL